MRHGTLAAWLLEEQLGDDARYVGVDLSPKMVQLARERLARWSPRAEVRIVDPPAVTLPGAAASIDRFLATYVFDLIPTADAGKLIGEARRLLGPDGLLCTVSLTHGETSFSRLVSAGWGTVASLAPALVGGCRPIEVGDLLGAGHWQITHREVVTGWGIPSEVLVARGRDAS